MHWIAWLTVVAITLGLTLAPLDGLGGGALGWWLRHDGLVHVLLFALLTGSVALRATSIRQLLFLAGLCLLFGAVIEIAQGWLPWDRDPEWADLLADALGVVVGATLIGAIRGRVGAPRRSP